MTQPLVVTPLELLSLADLWHRDRDLALRIAEESARSTQIKSKEARKL